MSRETLPATLSSATTTQATNENQSPSQSVKRRSFLKGLGVVGAALSAGSLLTDEA
jgi:hypothetical protein